MVKTFRFKQLFLTLFTIGFCSAAIHQLNFDTKTSNSTTEISIPDKQLDDCPLASNIQLQYEMGMPTAQLSWEGEQPQNGWILLYSYENSIDINWFLNDPYNYEQPEIKRETVHNPSSILYMNRLNPGMYELYVISDCGDGNLGVAEKIFFEMGERGEEMMGACDAPTGFNVIETGPRTRTISWSPNDGEFYQIAWGPIGMEMHENYFQDPQTGTLIVSTNPYELELYPPGAEEQKAFFLRKYCGGNGFSEWVSPQCYEPSNLESQVTDSEVILNWSANEGDFAWQVIYGPQGFDPNGWEPSVNMINAYDNPTWTIDLMTLEQGITYDFYVRTNCFGENYSNWVGPEFFVTAYIPCNPVSNMSGSHFTHMSADIVWTPESGESEWDVLYGVAPLNLGTAQMVNVNQPKAILMGLNPSTNYEVVVRAKCVNGENVLGEIYAFSTTEGDDVYCAPYFLSGCSFDAIDNLIISGENNSEINDLNTGCTDSNYKKNTDLVVDFAPGNQYFARVSHGNFPISGDNLAMWIDFNDDGYFDNETERVGDGALLASGFTNISFLIPTEAPPGQHRMRVMLAFNAYPYQLTPCNDGDSYSSNGEVHDYTANILSLPNCNSAIAGTTLPNFEVCPGEDFELSVLGTSAPAIGLTRKWQFSPANQNNWTDLEGGMLPNTIVYGGIQAPTDFRYVVSCSETGETAISNVLKVTLSADCYCKPESNCSGPGGLQINNVQISGETVDLNNPSGCSGDGYGDFTIKFPPDLKQGNTYPFTVTAYNSTLSDDKVKAWIDFNGNNVFENHEVIMDFPNGIPDYTISSTITIPTNVAPGLYRLRVRIGWWGSPTLTGCSVLGWGETEDYLIEVIPNENWEECAMPTNIVVEQEENSTNVNVSWTPGGSETQWEVVYFLAGFNPDLLTPILVQNNPSLVLTDVIPDTAYEVYVRAVCSNGKSEWSEPQEFQTEALGVEDNYFDGFSYYPVPTEHTINLSGQEIMEEVIIRNNIGQLQMQFKPFAKNASIDISKLSPGLYFMQVKMKNSVKSFKLIKK